MSSSNYCFLTYIQVSQEAGQVVWYSHLLQNFPQFIVIHTGFGVVNDEALQTAEKRREAKGKGEKEWYNHSNAEFQRITRRDKKAFLNDQCKEI